MINSIAVIVLVYCLKGICTINMILSEKMHFPINILPLGFILEKIHHKQRGIFVGSLFLLFRLKLPPPNTTAGPLCKEEENEPKEEEKGALGGGKVSLRTEEQEK